jgi:hypothetical protein
MNKNYMKEYIDFSNEFRKSNGSKESVEKMYDLLYELESIEKNKQESLVLSNVYILLGFHRSAFETFKEAADSKNTKDTSKLYVLEQKAKSHENNFIIKDLRKLRGKKEKVQLVLSDFSQSKKDEKKFKIKNKNIVVFNKVLEKGKFSIYLPNNHIEAYFDKIVEHINWLSNCKNELIDFYNKEQYDSQIRADLDWYDTLELYRVLIIINDDGTFTSVTAGDDFYRDHLLDIELSGNKITSMNYSG